MLPRFRGKSAAKNRCVHSALWLLVIANAALLLIAIRSGDSAPTQHLKTVHYESVASPADSAADDVDKKNKNDGDGELSVQDALAMMHDQQPAETDVEAPDSTGVDIDDSPEYKGTMPVKCMDTPPSLKNAHVSPKPPPAELNKWYGDHMRPFTSELDYWDYTIPFLNVTTVAKDPATPFHSGYHNQMMGFTAFFMKVAAAGHGQVLLRTIRHADLFGHKPGIFFQGK